MKQFNFCQNSENVYLTSKEVVGSIKKERPKKLTLDSSWNIFFPFSEKGGAQGDGSRNECIQYLERVFDWKIHFFKTPLFQQQQKTKKRNIRQTNL